MKQLNENLGNLKFLANTKEVKNFVIQNGYTAPGRDSAVTALNIKGADASKLNQQVNKQVRDAGEEFKFERVYVVITTTYEGKETPILGMWRWLQDRNWEAIYLQESYNWRSGGKMKWKKDSNLSLPAVGSILKDWDQDSYKAYLIFPDKKKTAIKKERQLRNIADKNFSEKIWDDEVEPLFSGASIIKVMKRGNSADSQNKKMARTIIAKLTDHVENAKSTFDYRKDMENFKTVMNKVVEVNRANMELDQIDPKKKYTMTDVKQMIKDKKK